MSQHDPSATPLGRKQGLRKPQIRILKVLAKAKGPMTADLLGEQAHVDPAWMPNCVWGRISDAPKTGVLKEPTPLGRTWGEKHGTNTLLMLGYVQARHLDLTGDGKLSRVWEITPAGRHAIAAVGEKKQQDRDRQHTSGRRKTGLRAPQFRILRALTAAKRPLTGKEICEQAPVDSAWLADALFGRIGDQEGRVLTKPTPLGQAQEQKQGYKSLLGLGFVKAQMLDVNGKEERVWEITSAGIENLKEGDKAEGRASGPADFAYEEDLRNYLAEHLHLIEPGLTLFKDEQEGLIGVEYPVGGRYIDILAVSAQGDFVVIELKVSRGYERVVGQLMRYMGWVRTNLAKGGQNVRGVIVARRISEDLKIACSELKHADLLEYEMAISLKRVSLLSSP
jgi:hypothetical protein